MLTKFTIIKNKIVKPIFDPNEIWEILKIYKISLNKKQPFDLQRVFCLSASGGNRTHTPERSGF